MSIVKHGKAVTSEDYENMDVLKTASLEDLEGLVLQLLKVAAKSKKIGLPEAKAFEIMSHKAAKKTMAAVVDACSDIFDMLEVEDEYQPYALMTCLGILALDTAETFLGNLDKDGLLEVIEKKAEDGDCEGCCPKCGGECEPEDGIEIDGDGVVVCRCKECGFEWIS